MKWWLILGILCSYGFLKEFRPSEPYLYQYQNQDLNISDSVLIGEVYPYWTYCYLIFLIPVFLLTDILLYKPILLLESLSYVVVWILLLWGRTVLSQKFVEVFYGSATATEIAYYSYIYAKVDKNRYQRVTSWTRAAVQSGKCFANVISQLIISFKLGNYKTLNYISLGSVSTIFIFALALPSVSWRRIINISDSLVKIKDNSSVHISISTINIVKTEDNEIVQDRVIDKESCDGKQPQNYKEFVIYRLKKIWREFKTIYSDGFIVKWSLWWALATCGYFQVANYIQTLWATVQTDLENPDVYNGVVEAANTFLGTITILLMQRVHVNWAKWGELLLTGISLLDCGLLLLLSYVENMWVMYVAYVTYCVLYQTMITIAQFCLADKLVSESFGLVLGFDTFVALALQTVLTLAFADKSGFHLLIRSQFVAYGSYHGMIALIFFAIAVVTLNRQRRRPDST